MNDADLKLWKKYKRRRTAVLREEIVRKYLYLVKYVAGRVAIGLPPNVEFNDLVSYGLLEKSGPSTRGGRRAYYRMPDRADVVRAVEAWRASGGERRRPLRFVAAGASTEPPADTARQAGEISYAPRSWR